MQDIGVVKKFLSRKNALIGWHLTGSDNCGPHARNPPLTPGETEALPKHRQRPGIAQWGFHASENIYHALSMMLTVHCVHPKYLRKVALWGTVLASDELYCASRRTVLEVYDRFDEVERLIAAIEHGSDRVIGYLFSYGAAPQNIYTAMVEIYPELAAYEPKEEE